MRWRDLSCLDAPVAPVGHEALILEDGDPVWVPKLPWAVAWSAKALAPHEEGLRVEEADAIAVRVGNVKCRTFVAHRARIRQVEGRLRAREVGLLSNLVDQAAVGEIQLEEAGGEETTVVHEEVLF